MSAPATNGAAALNAVTVKLPAAHFLDVLVNEAVYILREVAAQFENPALLFSGGKDSTVLVHLALKAFTPTPVPFPLMHIDTGHNFSEVLAFRDALVARHGLRLVLGSVEDSIRLGRVVLKHHNESRNAHQTVTLLGAIEAHGFDACIGGARRDEEKARAKERVFSVRDAFGQWQPHSQRPELWEIYNGRIGPGEHMRVFPLSNWTEADIWRYIARENVELPDLYYAHEREVVRRNDRLVAVTPLTPAREGEIIERLSVRFRTVGDMTCTCPVESVGKDAGQILLETLATTVSERGATRLDDRTSQAAMEFRKRAGYF